MHLIASTILAWLNLVGWLIVSVVLWGNRQAIFSTDETAMWVLIALAGWIVVGVVAAFAYTERCSRFLRCRSNAAYRSQLTGDLKSDKVDPSLRRLALRTLADHCGEPFGLVGFWPFVWYEAWQFRAVRTLLKKHSQREAAAKVEAAVEPQQQPDSQPPKKKNGPILEPLSRGAAETLDRLGEAIKDTVLDWTPDDADNAAPAEVPLPPLPAEQFVEMLRSPFEIVLSSLAETINAAPDARAVLESRDRAQELFGGFLDEALELGLKLRVDAAVAELPVLNASTCEWHAADPELRGPTRSWVEKYRRMKADESNLF